MENESCRLHHVDTHHRLQENYPALKSENHYLHLGSKEQMKFGRMELKQLK